MGTTTAQMLVGQKHTYESGIINARYELTLSENSMPAWSLFEKPEVGEKAKLSESIIWIPTVKRMLEDGLLMVGLYVLKDEELMEMAEKYIRKQVSRKAIGLYDDIDPEHLELMYKRSRQLDQGHKIVLTVLGGSTVRNQIHVLKDYPMDVEVCMPVFKRERNPWNGEKEIWEGGLGSLT